MKMIFEETILYKKKLPPLPLPADAWYNQNQHTQLISSPTSQSKTKYLKNVENFMKVFFYWRGKTNLGIKDFSCFNRIGERTKYKSGGNLSIIDTLHLNFDIFTRGHWRDIDIIRPDLLHFDFSLQQRRICLNLLGCNKFSGNEVIVYGQIILNLFYIYQVSLNKYSLQFFLGQRAKRKNYVITYYITLLGITSKVSPFLQNPLSTFPITMVPMSLYLEGRKFERNNLFVDQNLLIYDWHHEGSVYLTF